MNRFDAQSGIPPVLARKEVELKLLLPPKSLPALKKVPFLRAINGLAKRTTEVSVYFDTDKRQLHKQGLILRVRKVGDQYVQTIKSSGGASPFERDEWEAAIAGEQPDLRLAKGTALETLLCGKLRGQLKPLFETRVRRSFYHLTDDTRALALTIDRGTIDTGKRSLPLCEIELELEHGDVSDLFKFARELIRFVPARLALKSKSERGYELVDGGQDMPVKAGPINISADASTRDAFQMIGSACLEQIIGNEAAVIKGDPEGVHQMRVGLRRLRAGMSLFAGLVNDPQSTALKAGLKRLATELGPARELEVLVKRVVAPIRRQRARWDTAVPALSRDLVREREKAVVLAQHAVRSSRFRALTLEIATWLQSGEWTMPQDELVRDRGDLPIGVFATERLSRRFRNLCRRREALAQLDARSLHKLRIQTKKLRYAVEFLANLFTSKRASKRRKLLAPVLERLQDALGELNDIAVDEARLAVLGRRRGAGRNRAFAAGLLTGREDARIEAALKRATQAYAQLAKVKPFWE